MNGKIYEISGLPKEIILCHNCKYLINANHFCKTVIRETDKIKISPIGKEALELYLNSPIYKQRIQKKSN